MKIFCTKPKANGDYNGCGTDYCTISDKYKTIRGFIRYGLPSDFYGNTLKIEVYYGDNTYRAADKVMYVTV